MNKTFLCGRGLREVGAPRMRPMADFRASRDYHQGPAVELQTSAMRVPCERCMARAEAGDPANPFHPCCSARLASQGIAA